MLREGDELVVAASAGNTVDARGRRMPVAQSTSGQVLERERPELVTDVASRLRIAPDELGVPDAHTALLVPMMHRGVGLGVLAAFDRGQDAEPFTDRDEQLLRTFAASAANAVAISRTVEAERLRSAIAASDAERGRWARELHDQTLQTLAGLRVGLSSALRADNPARYADATRQAIADIESEIRNLRAIITDLRPSLLDDLGLQTALEALVERRRAAGLAIEFEFTLPDSGEKPNESRDLETAVYRLVQESLTNVVKHAAASNVRVAVVDNAGQVVVEVSDDGGGFDTEARHPGFGLAGMGERVFLLGGSLEIDSGAGGTLVRARIPHGLSQQATSAVT